MIFFLWFGLVGIRIFYRLARDMKENIRQLLGSGELYATGCVKLGVSGQAMMTQTDKK